MERVLDVAQYIMDEYKKMTGETIDEMKLHKLLYFSQRECLALTNKPLFEEQLEGWKYGPVCRDVRSAYTTDGMNDVTQPISDEAAYIVKNVIFTYGGVCVVEAEPALASGDFLEKCTCRLEGRTEWESDSQPG